MNLKIRKLKARDIFKFSKILKKLNDKNSLQNIIKTANEKNLEEKDRVELYGTEIVCLLIENLDEVEEDIYEFLADLVGMTPEAFSNLDLSDLIEIIRKIAQENNLSAFFAAVSKLTDSK